MLSKQFLQFVSIVCAFIIVLTSIKLLQVTNQPYLSPGIKVETGSLALILITILIISVMLLIISLLKTKKIKQEKSKL